MAPFCEPKLWSFTLLRSSRTGHIRSITSGALSHASIRSRALTSSASPTPVPNKQPHLNFRSFVAALREDGDLADIDAEVDPDGEVGAVTRKVYETREKAPLFNNVRGAQDGLFRILGAPGGLRKGRAGRGQYGRLAMHFGLPSDASPRDIIDKVMSVKFADPVPPTVVATAPCKDHVISGDDIDLTSLPVPLLHGNDGGRYLQSFGMHVVQTPDQSWTNWSIARSMVHSKNKLTGIVAGSQHLGMIHKMWKEKGEDTPWALALGVPPTAIAVSGMPIPENVNESGYVGALAGAPVDVIKCETNDLYIPATSEIVLEGTISASERANEGPMGEMFGVLWPGKQANQPVFNVKAITHRKDAILPISVAGRAPDETHTIFGFLASASILEVCERHDLPVKSAWVPHETYALWAALQLDMTKVRAMNLTRQEFCRRVGDVIFGSHAAATVSRILLVGEDIEPTRFDDVLWASTTRCRPGQDEYLFEDAKSFYLVPFMSHGPGNPHKGGRVVADCLFTEQWTQDDFQFVEASFDGGYPKEVRDFVNANWKEKYGFGKCDDALLGQFMDERGC
ncbi:MAG: hypothetical protein M1819_007321 [Sarea resinae]|nr:MAG: hypothetical protein M1819_007321 [Sarea resinae]